MPGVLVDEERVQPSENQSYREAITEVIKRGLS